MLLHPRIFSSAVAVALTCAVSAAAYYYKSRKSQPFKASIEEVMVFCKLQYNACNYFDKLISYVEAAKESVNVCMPSIHNPAIQGRLVSLIKNSDIKIRMIIDRSGYNESTNFFIKELIEAGAEIKHNIQDPINKMRHKFCLVDDKVLMIGTLDWGNDLSADHWNYVYITNKLQLVEPVRNEFYRMWSQCCINLDTGKDSSDDEKDVELIDVPSPEIISKLEQREKSLTPEWRI